MNSVTKTIFTILCLMIVNLVGLNAQWTEDFESLDLSSWTGDIDQFKVNDDNQLQLNAPEAGEVSIFHLSTIDFDTVSIQLYHKLDFSPSSNNRSTIYLAVDSENISIANGYYLEIGENGSNDAINIFYLDNGSPELIAKGVMGAMGSEPAIVTLQINIYKNGLWEVKTNYDGGEFTSLDIEFMDDRFSFSDSQFFGLSCKYSASRSDKFFYDDISIKPFEQDLSPPEVISATPIGDKQIQVKFNEPVDETQALNISNYQLDNGIGNPESILNLGGLGNEFILTFGSSFSSAVSYTLSISNIEDFNQNKMIDQSFQFLFAGSPELGDLLISEILFDPYSGGEDFIEIYNVSDKNLELQGMIIRNDDRDESKSITSSIILAAKSYVAFTEEVSFLNQEYKPDPNANIVFQDIPSLNNDAGNVMIINSQSVVLDSFDYNENQHFQLIDDTEGVSLERISFDISTNDLRNWQSGSQNARYATPGYENSNKVSINPGDESFSLVSETFSPNQDGVDDVMILNYNLEKTGFVANINIHDAAGYKIKKLSQNELLSSQGIITWDGTNEEGAISDLGIYIIVGKLFHTDGDVMNFKKVVVLADFID